MSLTFDLFHFRTEVDPYYHLDRISAAAGENSSERGLAQLKDLAEQHHFKPLIAVWPNFEDHEVNDAGHPADARHPGQLLVETLAEKYGIPVFRLSPYFQAPKGQNPRALYSIGDGMHASVLGAHVAADALYEILGKAAK